MVSRSWLKFCITYFMPWPSVPMRLEIGTLTSSSSINVVPALVCPPTFMRRIVTPGVFKRGTTSMERPLGPGPPVRTAIDAYSDQRPLVILFSLVFYSIASRKSSRRSGGEVPFLGSINNKKLPTLAPGGSRAYIAHVTSSSRFCDCNADSLSSRD